MDVDKLLGKRHRTPSGFPEDTLEVPGVGTVKVRGLSRLEALEVRDARGTAATEVVILSRGMLDPALTIEQVIEWQRVSEPDEIEPVSRRIAQLSGMLPSSPKEVVKEFEANPDAEFRAVPSPEIGDDGSAPQN